MTALSAIIIGHPDTALAGLFSGVLFRKRAEGQVKCGAPALSRVDLRQAGCGSYQWSRFRSSPFAAARVAILGDRPSQWTVPLPAAAFA